jgi:hypothetical protein
VSRFLCLFKQKSLGFVTVVTVQLQLIQLFQANTYNMVSRVAWCWSVHVVYRNVVLCAVSCLRGCDYVKNGPVIIPYTRHNQSAISEMVLRRSSVQILRTLTTFPCVSATERQAECSQYLTQIFPCFNRKTTEKYNFLPSYCHQKLF